MYSNFVSTLNNCIDKHFPKKKTITVRPRVFINGTIRQLMRKRNRIYYKAIITNNPQHLHSYRQLRNRIIDEIRKST